MVYFKHFYRNKAFALGRHHTQNGHNCVAFGVGQ